MSWDHQEREAYLRHTQPDDAAVDRLRSRLRSPPPATRPWAWALVPALALALLLLWPRPPQALSEQLNSPSAWEQRQPILPLKLGFTGSGALGGQTQAPTVDWQHGTLKVELDPAAKLPLTVTTREATVQVLGTVFTVTRDALGTAVSVQRGQVRTRCVDGQEHLLGPGDSVECLPDSAAGLLGRVLALQKLGTPPDERLTLLERAAQSAEGAVADELAWHRAQTLLELRRDAEALAQARAALLHESPRRPELLRLAAALALQLEGCPGALPYLQALAPTQADAAQRLAACQ